MARLNRIVFGILILQMYVQAAPSDVSKLEDIAKVEQAEPKLDPVPANNPKLDSESKSEDTEADQPTDSSVETQRQKRWYNPYGYGFPPMNPLIYSGFNKRDEGPNTGFYGGEDPLTQIHRRIQEIASIVRQPPPPPPPHIPIFFPVLFVPTSICDCNQNPTQTDSPPKNNTTPTIVNRWPLLDDERQNWGFLDNNTASDEDDDDEEFSRPISFDPIVLNKPMRPPPPVEHGTVEGSSSDNQGQAQSGVVTTTLPPTKPENAASPPGSSQSFSPAQRKPGLAPPSPCDGAILTCCHQAQVAYDCFAIQGCPDLSAYGNPCDPNVILRVIDRFQMFYGQKTG